MKSRSRQQSGHFENAARPNINHTRGKDSDQPAFTNGGYARQSPETTHLAKLAEMREAIVALTATNARLQQENRYSEARLEAMLASPAWKLIEAYRTWRRRQQVARPRLFHAWEQIAKFLLREMNLVVRPSRSTRPLRPNESASSPNEPQSQAKDADYERWIVENEPAADALKEQHVASGIMAKRPLFSIILPVYKVGTQLLRECIESVLRQSYDCWELCIVNTDPTNAATQELLAEMAACDDRLRVCELVTNKGIAGNSNAALELARGEFVVLLDHDDTIAPFALFEVACLVNNKSDTDLIYSDHDYLDEENGLRFNPLFKPAWSPEIMYSANYITHLTVIRRSLVEAVEGFDTSTEGAQDWDLFLKVAERSSRIEHIPKVLYHWRVHPESTALNGRAKRYAQPAQIRAIESHLKRTGIPAKPEVTAEGLLHLRWTRPASPLISIIIPSKDKLHLLSKCLETLISRTRYKNYELLIVDNDSKESATRHYYKSLATRSNIRVLHFPGRFNYSAANNYGASRARGELLLFLNNDVEFTEPEWLEELVGWTLHPPVGVVGARLLRKNGMIQHAGIILGLTGFAGHVFANQPRLTFNSFGSTGWYRNYLAVTGACMMMRRDVFDEIGKFDESFRLGGSDVEICLRARQKGYRIVYNPFAELVHHESQTRKADFPVEDFFTSYTHYRPYLEAGDPYWSPNLSVWKEEVGLRSKGEPSSLGFVLNHLDQLNPPGGEKKQVSEVSPLAEPRVGTGAEEESGLLSWFDFDEKLVARSRLQMQGTIGHRSVKTITWFIPPFANAFYGGIYTILRFADHWHRRKGVRNTFAVCGTTDRGALLREIQKVCPDVSEREVFNLPNPRSAAQLPHTDACIATLWATAYYALHFHRVRRKFYFVQDYESAFYPAGSISALVESTYHFGFYGIANTSSLREFYEREHGGKAIHFTPRVNTRIFNAAGRQIRREPRAPWQVFCYARPQHPRNAFQLLAAAMQKVKARLGNKVRIVSAGAEWNPMHYSLHGVVENLGLLPYEKTAQLYRESDAGVVLMLTRHPSYIPLELMATGCLVITNRNHWTEWLLSDGQNCLLSEPSPSSLADKIELGLRDESLRSRICRAAEAEIREKYSDWSMEMDRVYDFMCDPENATRAPQVIQTQRVTLVSADPLNTRPTASTLDPAPHMAP